MKPLTIRKTVWVFSTIPCLLFLFSNCLQSDVDNAITNSYGEQFAGNESCKKCHSDIYNAFVQTGHCTTSGPGKKEFIKGSFKRDSNEVSYNYYDRVIMEDRDSGFYQASFYKNTQKNAERMDIVIGSGIRGQSYLYWKNNSLFQLPVSYFTPLHAWANSPGNGEAISYNRIVYSRCLECHTTYVKALNNSTYKFDIHKIMYGVTCESCHGAGQKHVTFHEQNEEVKIAKYIINPGALSRQQQLDQCALCHSGTKENIKPSFSFIPGDTLNQFYKEKESIDSNQRADVHGNKYNLLTQSKCFKNSQTMTCTTCHNTHQNERGNVALFSKKCMSCHTPQNQNFCKMAPSIGAAITQNCVDCHMPKQSSTVLTVFVPEQNKWVAAVIRQHLITIYPNETEKVVAYLKSKTSHN